ncbi:MAG: aspartyl-phosphate phosphatase Spo0E family protein [Bacillota bacterium]
MQELLALIEQKKAELNRLVDLKQTLLDEEVCKKSCELDVLVVEYMRGYGKKLGTQRQKGLAD